MARRERSTRRNRDTPPGTSRAGRRMMRRTMQPRRPLVYPDQWALVLLTVVAILGGLALVAFGFFR